MGRLLRWMAMLLLLAAIGAGLYVGVFGGAGGTVTEKSDAAAGTTDKGVLASAEALKAPAPVEDASPLAAPAPAAPAAAARASREGMSEIASFELTLQALWPSLKTRAGAVRLDFARTGRVVVVAEAKGAANIQVLAALAGNFAVAGNQPFAPLDSDIELVPRDEGQGVLVLVLGGTAGSARSEAAFLVSNPGPVTLVVADRTPGGGDLRRPPASVTLKVYFKAQ